MSPPETWTPKMAKRLWNCCATCTATAPPSVWLRTTSAMRILPSAQSISSTAASWKKLRKPASEPISPVLNRNGFHNFGASVTSVSVQVRIGEAEANDTVERPTIRAAGAGEESRVHRSGGDYAGARYRRQYSYF